MRVVFAPDKFKGSLTAREAADAMARGWQSGWPGCETISHPVADGGDGTLEVVEGSILGVRRSADVDDARGRTRRVPWLWHEASRTAWAESSLVLGLAALPANERHPPTATTAGLGQLIRKASETGATRIVIALGGSATNDAGCGMAAAMGFRFLDAEGRLLEPLPAGLARLARIEPPASHHGLEVVGLVDVDNPLLGPRGASRTYAPQKGATPAEVEALEETLARIAALARRDLAARDPGTPGDGAAGGLGYGLVVFLGGLLRPGFDAVAEVTGLRGAVESADLIVTGEGRLDSQTFSGKAPVGVARLARECGKPVIALAGSIPHSAENHAAFDAVLPVANEPMPLDQAMQQAGALTEQAAARTARLVRLGNLLPAT